MNKLKIDFTNCFGIKRLSYEFDFSKGNVFSVYARNGLMKTSFANTFQRLQQGKEANICDKIFDYEGKATVQADEMPINNKQIFVIKSYENSYEADISPLLIKGELKDLLQETFDARTKFLKALEKDSGLKIKRTSQGENIYELESQIVQDFSFQENSILLNLVTLQEYIPDVIFEDVKYTSIFDASALKKINNRKFQEGIADFISSSDEIYEAFGYLEKGKLNAKKKEKNKKLLEAV